MRYRDALLTPRAPRGGRGVQTGVLRSSISWCLANSVTGCATVAVPQRNRTIVDLLLAEDGHEGDLAASRLADPRGEAARARLVDAQPGPPAAPGERARRRILGGG